jgi:hypothetical protein
LGEIPLFLGILKTLNNGKQKKIKIFERERLAANYASRGVTCLVLLSPHSRRKANNKKTPFS